MPHRRFLQSRYFPKGEDVYTHLPVVGQLDTAMSRPVDGKDSH